MADVAAPVQVASPTKKESEEPQDETLSPPDFGDGLQRDQEPERARRFFSASHQEVRRGELQGRRREDVAVHQEVPQVRRCLQHPRPDEGQGRVRIVQARFRFVDGRQGPRWSRGQGEDRQEVDIGENRKIAEECRENWRPRSQENGRRGKEVRREGGQEGFLRHLGFREKDGKIESEVLAVEGQEDDQGWSHEKTEGTQTEESEGRPEDRRKETISEEEVVVYYLHHLLLLLLVLPPYIYMWRIDDEKKFWGNPAPKNGPFKGHKYF